MSKFVEAMDAFVRLVVITVFTTGALQITGVVQTPTTVTAYPQFEIRTDLHLPEQLNRVTREDHSQKQQQTNATASLIDDIFNIPIATLHAVNTLVQNSQPVIQQLRKNAQERRQNRNIAIAEGERIPKKHRKRYRTLPTGYRTVDSSAESTENKNAKTTKIEIGDAVV